MGLSNILVIYIIFLAILFAVSIPIAQYFVKTKKITFDWAMFFLVFGFVILGAAFLSFINENKNTETDDNSIIDNEMISNNKSKYITYIGISLAFSIFFIIEIFQLKILQPSFFGFAHLYGFFLGIAVFYYSRIRKINNKPVYTGYIAAGAVLLVAFISLTIFGWSDILTSK